MAEALLKILLENVIPLVQREFAAFSGIKEKTEDLSRTLVLIRAVLEDAEEKQWSNHSIKIWLQQLKDAVYQLDDVLNQLPTESSQHGFLSSFKPENILLRRNVGHKLNEIKKRLGKIAKDKNDFLLREGVRERPSEVAEWRKTSPTITSPQVYGRDGDKEKVVEFLLSPTRDTESLSVYPIVGLGGLGKTTLAQFVYNDERVSNHFNLKIWLCISENFDVTRILCSIVQSVTKDKCEMLELPVVEEKVKGLLQGKKFLLVLDDVWIKNQQMEFGLSQDKWDRLKSVLFCGSKGASILVSTRDRQVATIMGTYQAHDLSGISDDDCWSLFKHYAFTPDKEDDEELVQIGKEIVSRCGGSPLAAKALGGLVRSKTREEWLMVKESSLWNLPDEDRILPALKLSYSYLTPTLKQCFTFCAIFPKDQRINKQELIHLWMANGFISSQGKLNEEELGNRHWNELCQKSFFQDVKIDEYSGDIYFKMHDLVHDLAQSITDKECLCLEEANLTDLPRNTHHIGFRCNAETKTPFKKGACEKVESLRTLYHLGWRGWSRSKHSYFYPSNSSLRVLCIRSSKFPSLENFRQLRYLGLHGLDIETIPDSIYSLHKLEILKLMDCEKLCRLPKHLTRLHNLRHLVIEDCDSLSEMCPDISKLSQLRTLSKYMVKSKQGHSLAELWDLNLGGQLRIEGLENVGSISEAEDANLKGKQDLQVLSLDWGVNGETKSFAVEEILEVLQPHSNLKQLDISHYKGLCFPTWMGNNSTLKNLASLVLISCVNCRQLPSLGRLPSLRTLEIGHMDNVRYIDEDESYDGVEAIPFPSLQELIVNNLPNVERLLKRETADMFPSLSTLLIINCPKLLLPCLPRLKDLTYYVWGCSSELPRSISNLNGLNKLDLSGSDEDEVWCFPEGMMKNMTSLATLTISNFRELKELPSDFTKLTTLSDLSIRRCDKLVCLPEQGFEDLCSLRSLSIEYCEGLRWLPEGVRHLTSLEYLSIVGCPALIERCKEGTGEDWHKIAHIPKLIVKASYFD